MTNTTMPDWVLFIKIRIGTDLSNISIGTNNGEDLNFVFAIGI